MKKILLVYLPFCTPASPPYSITNLYSFLKKNSKNQIEVLDLNLEFHKLKFPMYQKYFQSINPGDYDKISNEFNQLSGKIYSENNKKVVNGEKPELFDELLKKIIDKKPDIITFSIVYSSQAFYAYSLIKGLTDITTVIGGPAVNEKLKTVADITLNNEIELLDLLDKKEINDIKDIKEDLKDNKNNKDKNVEKEKIDFDYYIDYSIYNLNEYFTPYPVIPIKTSSTCYYKKCVFCNHFSKSKYIEFDLNIIKKTVVSSKHNHFFLIDDMISKKRLLEIANMFRPLNKKWTCQLRPTKDLDYKTLKILKKSGLSMVIWGVESSSDRILNLIQKGTNKSDIGLVLKNSHKAGIKNVVYILFGFPSETKDEFIETIEFLKENDETIDLISPSVFGLQRGTAVYRNPKDYGISKIFEEQRTILEPKISYEIPNGLSQKEVIKLKHNYRKTISNINKFPNSMNYFREHMFCLID